MILVVLLFLDDDPKQQRAAESGTSEFGPFRFRRLFQGWRFAPLLLLLLLVLSVCSTCEFDVEEPSGSVLLYRTDHGSGLAALV